MHKHNFFISNAQVMDHRWVVLDGIFQISLRFGEKNQTRDPGYKWETKAFRTPSIANFV